MTEKDTQPVRNAPYPPFRSDRFHCENGQWYFAVRRGPDQGPYASREEAEAALERFLGEQQEVRRQNREPRLGRHPAVASRR